MLSRTHREMRKDCLLRLHSESEEGEKWSRKFDPDELADESSEVKADEADEDVTTNEENQEENLEVDIVGHEEFAGFIKKEAFDHYQSKGFDDKFFVYSDSALVLPSEKKETYQTLSNFFIENRGNWPTMHKYLNYASHEYIERLVAALFIQSPLEKHVLNQFITLFTNLSTNPLNEIRFMDMIVTLASLDAEDANTLNTFNQYFGTVLTKDEFASKKHSFLGEVINIIEEYLSLTIEGKNAVEHSHFDELLASTEKIGEIMPFKLKIKIVASVVTPKVVYSAIARKIIDSDSDNKQLFEKAVKAIIKVELTHLSPYHKDPIEASHAVQAALECMVSVDKMSKLRMNLLSSIANCLENDHVLFSFLNLLQQTYHLNLECAHQELVNIVATLKLELKGEADNDQVKEILKQISQNKDLVKIQLVLQLLAKQSENVIQSLKEAKDRFTTHQESLCANLKKLIANLLEEKGLKNIYMYAIQIFELLEDIKKATPPSDWDLSQLESALDLIVDMYRIFKAHGSLAEIEERIGFVGVSKEEIKQDGKETTNTSSQMFSRVSTKTNDHMPQEEELLLSIPGLQRSMTAIRESGEVKYDELLSRLTVKAKSLVQEVKLSKLPSAKYVLEIAVKREYERFTQFPWLLKFDKKREIFDMLLSKEKDSYSSDTLKYNIRRKHILKDSKRQFEIFLNEHPYSRIAGIQFKIEFLNEEGIDAGGLRNEWLALISKELFDPRLGLFKVTENRLSIQPDPSSRIVPGHLSYFHFAGCIVGYAVANKLAIPVNFTRSFLKLITDREIAVTDLADVDQQLMNSLEWMLKNNVEELLDHEFTYDVQLFGHRYTIKLGEPHEHLGTVNEKNKKDYVNRLIYYRLSKEIEPQTQAFKQGFQRFINPEYLQIFSASELDKLIAGDPNIDFEELKATARYEGYTEDSIQVIWFWEIVKTFDQENLSALWFFATGMNRLGPGGFKDQKLILVKTDEPENSLPKSHTCFGKIDLPQYPTKEILMEKLILAISEGREGFGFQ